jgi:hypothetical protein
VTVGGLVAEPFRPRWPWLGGDLQTLRNQLRRPPEPPAARSERLLLPLRDGDRLVATLDRPPDPLATAPTILLIHGLGGSAASVYMRDAAAHFLAAGHRVIRLNLRGAGPSAAECRGWANAGSWPDLADAIAALPGTLTSGGLVAVAFSLGGNTLLRLAAEGPPVTLGAVVTVSTPLDLGGAARRLRAPCNRVYDHYLLRATRRGYTARLPLLPTGLQPEVALARDLVDLDERVTAPLHGHGSAWAYYAWASCGPHLGRIGLPALLVHAADDPFVPVDPYRALTPTAAVHALVPPGGGHVGFHDRKGLWHLRQISSWLAGL